MNELRPRPLASLDDVLEADAAARRHAVVALNALDFVTRDVPPGMLAVGVPARIR